jgi:hypothetical protein
MILGDVQAVSVEGDGRGVRKSFFGDGRLYHGWGMSACGGNEVISSTAKMCGCCSVIHHNQVPHGIVP